MNLQVEVTWRTLRTIAQSIMVNAQVSEEYLYFALMYTTDHIFPVTPIKHVMNKYGEPNMPQKLNTGTKPSVSNLHFYLYMCCKKGSCAC